MLLCGCCFFSKKKEKKLITKINKFWLLVLLTLWLFSLLHFCWLFFYGTHSVLFFGKGERERVNVEKWRKCEWMGDEREKKITFSAIMIILKVIVCLLMLCLINVCEMGEWKLNRIDVDEHYKGWKITQQMFPHRDPPNAFN